METFSALLTIYAGNLPVTGEFPAQRPVTRSFDVFFGLRLNKRLSKQSWGWWFETQSCSLWRQCNVLCCLSLFLPDPYPFIYHSNLWSIQTVAGTQSLLPPLQSARVQPMGLLPDTYNCGLRMRRECRDRFPRNRELAISISITASAWRTCRDACRVAN